VNITLIAMMERRQEYEHLYNSSLGVSITLSISTA